MPLTACTEVLLYHSMQRYTGTEACFEHSNFFTVKRPARHRATQSRAPGLGNPDRGTVKGRRAVKPSLPCRRPCIAPRARLSARHRDPTTSVSTAAALTYAIGAGITAAAGTRLALQLILAKGFKFYSFQLQDMDALYCYFLSLPPCVRIG